MRITPRMTSWSLPASLRGKPSPQTLQCWETKTASACKRSGFPSSFRLYSSRDSTLRDHTSRDSTPRGDHTPGDSTPRDSTLRDSTPRDSTPSDLTPRDSRRSNVESCDLPKPRVPVVEVFTSPTCTLCHDVILELEDLQKNTNFRSVQFLF